MPCSFILVSRAPRCGSTRSCPVECGRSSHSIRQRVLRLLISSYPIIVLERVQCRMDKLTVESFRHHDGSWPNPGVVSKLVEQRLGDFQVGVSQRAVNQAKTGEQIADLRALTLMSACFFKSLPNQLVGRPRGWSHRFLSPWGTRSAPGARALRQPSRRPGPSSRRRP